MRHKHKGLRLLLLCVTAFCILTVSCRSITRSRGEIGIPRNVVIFSFDDGPNAHKDTTARLLDILKKYQIHAMFCLLGENAEYNPDLVRRIHDEGHILINHGYSDKWAVDMDKDEFRVNILKAQAAIEAAAGQPLNPMLYRPHGGWYKKYHRRVWQKEGYQMVAGSARAYDAVLSAENKKTVIKRIMGAVKEQHGGIILLHDARDSHFFMEKGLEENPHGEFNRSWIPDATEEIILRLLERGYTLTGFDIIEVLGVQ